MKELNDYNKRPNYPENKISAQLNTHQLVISVFYSVKLIEYNKIYNLKFGSVVSARIGYIVLNHLNSYQRTIKQDFVRLYNLRRMTLNPILEEFVTCGFLIAVNTRRKSNLGLLVPLTAFQITSVGKSALLKINELIASKIDNTTAN